MNNISINNINIGSQRTSVVNNNNSSINNINNINITVPNPNVRKIVATSRGPS